MTAYRHKFTIGETVCLMKHIHKKHGTVIAQEHGYGLPTYVVKLEDDTVWTLCENDLSSLCFRQ